MENFFIEVSEKGLISDIKWSNPTHLITSLNYKLKELFTAKDGDTLEIILESGKFDKDGFISVEGLEFFDGTKNFNLCLLNDEKKFYVFGSQSADFLQGDAAIFFKETIHSFMLTMRDYIRKNPFASSTGTRFQFESIQSLNNQLINTKRMLEKANARLKVLNDDLNNRLVKDALTGLLSRYQYRAEIESLISIEPDETGVFVFIDIDDFKSINDTYGHAIGDLYLVEFAKRLDSIPLGKKLTMRIAGDEFGIYIHGIPSDYTDFIGKIWDKIKIFIIEKPFYLYSIEFRFKVSAGMSVFGINTRHIYDLIDYADFAMYIAKKNGKNKYHIFDYDEYTKLKSLE